MGFPYIVTTFFTCHLTRERGLAAHTIASYSTTMQLPLDFAGKRLGVEVEKLRPEQLDRELILAFLDHLESSRGNGPSTRNQCLAAIKTFFHYLAETLPAQRHLSATVQAIREKAVDRPPPPSLTVPEVEAILAVPDPGHWLGHADLRTSCAYLEVSIRRKRQALDKLPPPAGAEPAEKPRWKQPKLMEFLSRLSRGVMLPTAGANLMAQACGTT